MEEEKVIEDVYLRHLGNGLFQIILLRMISFRYDLYEIEFELDRTSALSSRHPQDFCEFAAPSSFKSREIGLNWSCLLFYLDS